ncbi:S9 family peptidase [Rubripirellula tenax]|nr:prolyl oligopeptidase family serine peptidase [Rubripirellula tenax]
MLGATLFVGIVVGGIGTDRSVTGQEPLVTDPAKAKSPPELTLRSLLDPSHKKDFTTTLPAVHWIDDKPPQLLIQRDKTWMQVDLEASEGKTANEKPWPVVSRLATQLTALDGVKPDQAEKIARRSVAKMNRSTDAVLIKIGKAIALASPNQPARWLTRDGNDWKNATLDPTARRVAYTRDGDQFVVDVTSGITMRLTDDATDTLLDGELDWTYQEEIFGRGNYRGFWFSPNGDWLAMLRIDISGIEPYVLSAASSPRGSGVVRRYSKAGDAIPQAKLYVWDLRHSANGHVPPARLIEESTLEEQKLITGVWWHPQLPRMLYCVSDRLQTWRELRSVDSMLLNGEKTHSDLVVREQSPAWVEPPAPPQWFDDGSFLWQSEVPSGRNRLYHVSADGGIVRPISPESFDADMFKIAGDNTHVLVGGDQQRGGMEHHLYRIELSPMLAGDAAPGTTRITDTAQPWHDVDPSPDGRWFIDRASSPDHPPRMTVRSADGRRSFELAESTLKTESPIIAPELFTIPTPDGMELPAMLVKPTLTSDDQRVPVVIEVYGGPRSPSVSGRWSGTKTLYRELLARRGIATLVVDNRSSGGRGIADTWTIRGRFGAVEMKDLETTVAWLHQQPWVATDRLAIRGWSFGGFLTLYAMTHCKSFAAGIAGGSVTDWKEYDSIYTERYMGLPVNNVDGYAASSPLEKAKDLHGRLLMIHGEVDDNVHPSNTLRMAEALQNAGIDFEMMIYPGAAHAVTTPSQGWHLAQMTDRFLVETLLSAE